VTALPAIIAAVYGLFFGSFLNVVIYRAPRGESVAYPASHCPSCAHALRVWENIPLLSWLVLRGRCAHCAAPISSRYPIVEAITAALFALTALVFGVTWEGAAVAVLAATLVAVVFIDLDHLLILDVVLIPAALVGIASALASSATHGPRIGEALLGCAVCAAIFGVLYLVTRGAGMGLGDVKLAAVIGLYLGAQLGLAASLAAFVVGSVLLVPALIVGGRRRRDAVPFGPFLVIAALAALYVPDVLAWPFNLARLPFGT